MKQILYVLLFMLLNSSCSNRRTATDFIELGKNKVSYSSVEEYINERGDKMKENAWIDFRFLNNPYDLNENNLISIYVNDYLVYRGDYKDYLELKGVPDDIFADDVRMITVMEILTDKNKKKVWLHRFQNKAVFSWNEDYKIIYWSFLPTNESVENVFYIPHTDINF